MNKWVKRTLLVLAGAAALAADSVVTMKLASQQYAVRAASAPLYAGAEEDPIAEFRLERQQLRARQEAQLEDIIHAVDGDAGTIARAKAQLMDMMDFAERELTLEGILQSRGFEDALVTVSASSANVMLRRKALTQRETAVILDLVLRETGLTAGNVKIIPVK